MINRRNSDMNAETKNELKGFSQIYVEGYFDEDGFWVEGSTILVEFDNPTPGTPTYENMGQFDNNN